MTERSTSGITRVVDASRIQERLTPRELDVLVRMAAGLSNRAIAADLAIEYTAVRGHVRSVLEKLGAGSRFEAVARAYRRGLVRDSEARRRRGSPAAQWVARPPAMSSSIFSRSARGLNGFAI